MITAPSLTVWTHLAAALAAAALALTVLLRRKGTTSHVLLGRIWVGLMVTVALGSFWIQRSGSLSWIHGLSAFTLFSLTVAIFHARRYRTMRAVAHRYAHAGWMIGTFSGALIAGAFAFAPGRLLHALVFA